MQHSQIVFFLWCPIKYLISMFGVSLNWNQSLLEERRGWIKYHLLVQKNGLRKDVTVVPRFFYLIMNSENVWFNIPISNSSFGLSLIWSYICRSWKILVYSAMFVMIPYNDRKVLACVTANKTRYGHALLNFRLLLA